MTKHLDRPLGMPVVGHPFVDRLVVDEPRTPEAVVEQYEWFCDTFGDKAGQAFLDRLTAAARRQGPSDTTGPPYGGREKGWCPMIGVDCLEAGEARDPENIDEWQGAVDLAQLCLTASDAWRIVEGVTGVAPDRDRCERILLRGTRHGLVYPRPVDQVLAEILAQRPAR